MLQLPESRYADADARRAFFARLESVVAAIPGVEAAAVTTGVPPFDDGERLVEVEGRGGASGEGPRFASTVMVSPRFFEVVDRPLARGQNFRDTDALRAPKPSSSTSSWRRDSSPARIRLAAASGSRRGTPPRSGRLAPGAR